MKRVLKYLVIFSLIGIISLTGLAYWTFNSDLTSPPNRLWQYTFWKVPYVEYFFLSSDYLRRSCGFFFAGDEKYDFLRDNKYKNIVVDLYMNDHNEITENVPAIVESTLKRVFENKNIIIKNNDLLPENEPLNYDVLPLYNTPLENDNTKVLIIIVTNKKLDKFDNLFDTGDIYYGGLAIRSRTILLRYLTPTHYRPQSIEEYLLWWEEEYLLSLIDIEDKNRIFEHTLLHELGHILGLRHTNTPGCIMNPNFMANLYLGDFLEEEDDYSIKIGDVPLDYCNEEKVFLDEVINIPLIRNRKYLEDYYLRETNF
jgi:hypothetical protein